MLIVYGFFLEILIVNIVQKYAEHRGGGGDLSDYFSTFRRCVVHREENKN